MKIDFSRAMPWLMCLFMLTLSSCLKREGFPPGNPPAELCGTRVLYGYTDKISYYPGEEIVVYLQSTETVEVCNVGFYDIAGTLGFVTEATLFTQTISPNEPWKNGYNFTPNVRVRVPVGLASGIYFIEKNIPVVIKSTLPADVTIVYPVNTINAYCASGGKSLFANNSSDQIPAEVVSFLRPLISIDQQDRCMECLKWLTTLQYSINYISDLDLDNYDNISQSRIVVIPGHSEYWTRKARVNFDHFVNEGGHAIVLSGNNMWWQARYSAARDALVCYKHNQPDPEPDPSLKTLEWSDTTLHYPILTSIGADYRHGGKGLETDNGWNGFKIVNPASPLLEGLGFVKGDILALSSAEFDGAPVKGFDGDGFPILNNDTLNFEKFELIGFDLGTRGSQEAVATFIVMKPTSTSGTILNTGSYSWCSPLGMGSGASGPKTKAITENAILKMLNGENLFSH